MLDAKHGKCYFVARAKMICMAKSKKGMTASEMGRKGGRNRAKKLTKEQRSQIAKAAAKARWGRP